MKLDYITWIYRITDIYKLDGVFKAPFSLQCWVRKELWDWIIPSFLHWKEREKKNQPSFLFWIGRSFSRKTVTSRSFQRKLLPRSTREEHQLKLFSQSCTRGEPKKDCFLKHKKLILCWRENVYISMKMLLWCQNAILSPQFCLNKSLIHHKGTHFWVIRMEGGPEPLQKVICYSNYASKNTLCFLLVKYFRQLPAYFWGLFFSVTILINWAIPFVWQIQKKNSLSSVPPERLLSLKSSFIY